MGKMGKFDTKGMKEFQRQLENIQDPERFLEDCAKELAARLLAKVIKRTPTGDYSQLVIPSGKVGGTLKRGWTASEVYKDGSYYKVDVTNAVEYASYVEYGHRQEPGRFVPAIGKRLKRSWVKGQFMMTISENELQTIAPKVLEEKIKKYIRQNIH